MPRVGWQEACNVGAVMDFFDIVQSLERENPGATLMQIHAVADWILIWADASKNVRKHGSVVMDPRTANIIENPKLKIKERSEKALLKGPLAKVIKTETMDKIARQVEQEVICGIDEQFDVQ